MIETLTEFIHRITIEQQEADRMIGKKNCTKSCDVMKTMTKKRVKCAPKQDAREQIYIQLGV